MAQQSEVHAPARFAHAATGNAGVQLEEEERWVRRVRESLERETAETLGAVAKVYDVPRALRDTKPGAYAPHHFALGPYHRGRCDLMDMERYKLAAAKRVERLFAGDHKIDHLVSFIAGVQQDIRVTYHRFLGLNDETLAWMMAIDTCFLLDFLQNYHRNEAKDMVLSATNWISTVVRDALMLENQVPLFLFARTLELCHVSERQVAAHVLLFDRFIKDVCPIKISAERTIGDLSKHAHLLELLYHFLVPDADVFADNNSGRDALASAPAPAPAPEDISPDELEQQQQLPDKQEQLPDYDKVKQACVQASSLDVPPVRFVKTLVSQVSSLLGKLMRKVPVLAGLVPVLGKLMQSADVKERLEGMNLESIVKSAPLANEIKVPSVAQLAECGVRFVRAPDGISGIAFDRATATLSLPAITLDGNTEVILRNLVAYEAVAVRGPLVLARYTELMNGIVDTGKDVRILRQSGVVVNQMKNNKEAAAMWNGMSRATRLSKVPRLDTVIWAVNRHRDRTASVWARKLLTKYVFRSWRMLTLLASLVMLLLTALQTFCSAYPCKVSWFGAVLQLPEP